MFGNILMLEIVKTCLGVRPDFLHKINPIQIQMNDNGGEKYEKRIGKIF